MRQLAQHRAGLRVEPAEEHRVGLFGLDAGQDGHEIGGFVGGELFCHHLDAFFLGGGLEHVGQALAVGGAVVNHGDLLDFQGVMGVNGQRCAERVVIGNQAKRGLVAGLGQIGVGGRRGDVGNPAFVVDRRGRNGRARLQVADHARHLGVAQFLRHGSGLARVAGVVFGHQLELDLLAANHQVLRIQLAQSQADAVFSVFADVRDAAGRGASVGNLDDLHFLGVAHRSGQAQCRSGQGDAGTGGQQGKVGHVESFWQKKNYRTPGLALWPDLRQRKANSCPIGA